MQQVIEDICANRDREYNVRCLVRRLQRIDRKMAGDARAMFAFQQRHSPLGRGVSLEDLGGAGLYLLSDLSGGVTGEIHFVDSGYNIIAMPQPDALRVSGVSNGNGNGEETAKDAAQ